MPEKSRLTDELKDEIQRAYRSWLAARGFRARWGQRQMIADIARTLAGDDSRIAVVEAGTGTGKTVAYCLAAIPIAQAMDRRVVIATATVALQEQVVLRDLPDLQRHAGLDFDYALAKGRGRYLCVKRLEDRIAGNAELEGQLFEPPGADAHALYQRMRTAFGNGKWDGELDSWPDGVARAVWTPVTNDRAGCGAGRCGHYHHCPFFRARRQVAEADVVVANHDLVLADLALGGGVVLPDPAETIYVLDEAHHLPDRTRERFTVSVRLRASTEWLQQVASSLDALARRFGQPRQVAKAIARLADEAGDLRGQLTDLDVAVRALPFPDGGFSNDAGGGGGRNPQQVHRFPLGEVPPALAALAAPLGEAFAAVGAILAELSETLADVVAGDVQWDDGDEAEAWLPIIGQLGGRAAAGAALFRDYAGDEAMMARWITRHVFAAQDEMELTSAPLDPGGILREALWGRCHAAVATSATLCALGNFERFLANAGIGSDARQLRIRSPFDFANIAVLAVPAMRSTPQDREHTEEVAAMLPALLEEEPSALALFMSRRQFEEVVASLPDRILAHCRVQDAASKQELLSDHRAAIDAGEPSYLFGLRSFAEGVDLPGDYCRHVIIAKLPFTPPGDPVGDALSEWLDSQGRNAFQELAMPEASLRLIQACGRLIRHETDGGRVTLLDRRVVTKHYGELLLDALPPFRREFG